MPKERCEFLLPSGCKDLIDVLKLSAKKPPSARAGTPSPVIRLTFPFKSKPHIESLPVVFLPDTVVVKQLAFMLGVKLHKLIALLEELNVFAGAQQRISFHLAAKIAKRFGFFVQKMSC